MAKKIPPIFIVGSARSGTTLLYSTLLSSGIFPLYEAESLLLSVCRTKYGNLKKDKNYEKFLKDWFRSKQFIRSGVSSEFFLNLPNDIKSNYVKFLKEFKDKMVHEQAKSSWVEQTPANIYHIQEIIKVMPDAKFIHIIRDGRDVALSKRKIGWLVTKSKDPVKQLIAAGTEWEKSVTEGLKYSKILNENYLEIHYENLVVNLEDELQKINLFAGINITKEDISNSSVGALRKMNTAFGESKKGIQTSALYRWKKMLNEKELLMFNTAFKNVLITTGYPVNNLLSPLSIYYWQAIFYKRFYSFMIDIKKIIKNHLFIGKILPTGLEM